LGGASLLLFERVEQTFGLRPAHLAGAVAAGGVLRIRLPMG